MPFTDTSPGPTGNTDRRDFLCYATAGTGIVAAGAAVWPIIDSMTPSADVTALSSITIQKILNENGLGTKIDRWLALEAQNAEKAIEITPEQAAFLEKLNPFSGAFVHRTKA